MRIFNLFILLILFCNISIGQTINNGLVAFYPFNSNVNDESGNGNNGINNGAVFTKDRFNQENKSLLFDGKNSHCLIPLKSINKNEVTSISFWFKANENNLPDFDNKLSATIFSCKVNSKKSEIISISYKKDEQNTNIHNGSFTFMGEDIYFSSDRSLFLDKFYNITIIFGSTKIKYYLNGKFLEEKKGNFSFGKNTENENSNFVVGSYLTMPENRKIGYLKTQIDDIRIYNRELNDNEVLELFNFGNNQSLKNEQVLSAKKTSQIENDIEYYLVVRANYEMGEQIYLSSKDFLRFQALIGYDLKNKKLKFNKESTDINDFHYLLNENFSTRKINLNSDEDLIINAIKNKRVLFYSCATGAPQDSKYFRYFNNYTDRENQRFNDICNFNFEYFLESESKMTFFGTERSNDYNCFVMFNQNYLTSFTGCEGIDMNKDLNSKDHILGFSEFSAMKKNNWPKKILENLFLKTAPNFCFRDGLNVHDQIPEKREFENLIASLIHLEKAKIYFSSSEFKHLSNIIYKDNFEFFNSVQTKFQIKNTLSTFNEPDKVKKSLNLRLTQNSTYYPNLPQSLISSYPSYGNYIKEHSLNFILSNESNDYTFCMVGSNFVEFFPEYVKSNSAFINKFKDCKFSEPREISIFELFAKAFLSGKGEKSSSNSSDNDTKQDISTSNNESDFDKCEKISIPSVSKQDDWERSPNSSADRSYIEFVDGIKGYIFIGSSTKKYHISNGVYDYYYRNEEAAIRALYRYKKCGAISKIDKISGN